jgi:hypothetical protein
MITRARWTDLDESKFQEVYNIVKGLFPEADDNFVFETMSQNEYFDGKRTPAALQRHYAFLQKKAEGKPKMTGELEGFLMDVHNIKHAFETTLAENQRMKARIAELEAKEADFDAMAKAMQAASRFLAGEQQGRTQFRMDSNGNLEVMK